MDGADERDEPSRPLDAAGESLVDASRGEVTEEGDSRGDADGGSDWAITSAFPV